MQESSRGLSRLETVGGDRRVELEDWAVFYFFRCLYDVERFGERSYLISELPVEMRFAIECGSESYDLYVDAAVYLSDKLTGGSMLKGAS